MHPLSLHHIITPELSVREVVELSAKLDCQHVCLFMEVPDRFPFPTVSAANVDDISTIMRDCGVSLYAATSYPLDPTTDISAYENSLERSARLGAQYASSRIGVSDKHKAADLLARLGELAGQ